MNIAELNSFCDAESAWHAEVDNLAPTPAGCRAFRAGYTAGYRDGLAAKQTDGKASPEKMPPALNSEGVSLPKPHTADLCRNRYYHVSAWGAYDRERCPVCGQMWIARIERRG